MKVSQKSFFTGLGWLLSIFALNLTSIFGAIAETNSELNTVVLFQPPPEAEQPKTTEGAASRRNRQCASDTLAGQAQVEMMSDRSQSTASKLTALVPEGNSGLTTAAHPTFWVYLPQTTAQQAILSIREDLNPHWQQSIRLTGQAGVMGIKLPQEAPALETGKDYQWAIILVCGDRPHPNDPVVTANIKRLAPAQLRSKLPLNSTELNQAAWYARQGIWYDALDILSAEKFSLGKEKDLWVRYLQSGGLNQIAREPILRQ